MTLPFLKCLPVLQRRGMARIQRTHHPIFQSSLESAACVVTDHAPVSDASAAQPEAVPLLEPSADNVRLSHVVGNSGEKYCLLYMSLLHTADKFVILH